MKCPKCNVEMRITKSYIKAFSENDEIKVMQVQEYTCCNKQCDNDQVKVVETELQHC